MAYIPNQPEAEQPNQPLISPTAAPLTGGAGASGQQKPSANVAGVNTPAQPASSLNAYLSANAAQTGNFAGNIANTLGQQTSNVANQINSAGNVYTNNLAPQTVQTNTEVNQQLANSPSSLTPDQITAYQTELNAPQNAPNPTNTFEGTQTYGNLTGQIQNAVQQANLWNQGNNISNIQTAIQPFENNPTQGVSILDALLLSQTPGAYNQIVQGVAPTANLHGQLNTTATSADQALQAAITQDTAAQQAATQAAGQYATNLNTQLNPEITAAQNVVSENQNIVNDLEAGTPTQADLTTLNITPQQWATLSSEVQTANQNTANVPQLTPFNYSNLVNYLTQSSANAPTPTAATLATPQNYTDVAALQSILGANAPTLPINATTAAEAGTVYNPNTFNIGSAEANTQASSIVGQIYQLVNAANYASQQYQANHFGGQSPQQFNSYINGLQGQINGLQSQLQTLTSGPLQINTLTGAFVPAQKYSSFNADVSGLQSGINNAIPTGSQVILPIGAAQLLANVGLNALNDITSNNVGQDIGNFFLLANPMTAPFKVISDLVSCFLANTKVDMADGSTKLIQHIKIGDETKGGRVMLTIQGESSDFYDYYGITVTGSHTVNGYLKIKDTKEAKKLDLKTCPVYCFTNETHSIWIKGYRFNDAITAAYFDHVYLKDEENIGRQMLLKLIED
jgi:hypothetical protein